MERAWTGGGMFQIGIDGIILSQSAELLRPVDEGMLHSCAFSYRRCLEDLAFALVYADKILKYGSLRPTLDPTEYKAPHLFAKILERDSGILDQLYVDQDIHGDQLLQDRKHRDGIVHDMQLLEESVRSELDQPRFKEWLMREAAMYFGSHGSVFEKQHDPAEYQYADTVRYHTNREIQSSVGDDVIKILDSALPKTPKNLPDAYSDGARREFITRNMLSLVTIMRAYELSATRNGFWRMPHVTRACIRFLDLRKSQLELRQVVVRHTLYAALARSDSRDSVIESLCDLRNQPEPKAIRELLGNADLLVLNADEAKEETARTLIARINSLSPNQESSGQDAFVMHKWHSTLRELAVPTWTKYDDKLFRVFPELKPDRRAFFMEPPNTYNNPFRQLMTDTLSLYKRDGRVFDNVRACISGKSGIFVEDVRLPIEVGDRFSRVLPSGLMDTFVVDDPGYCEKFHMMEAHYQAKVHRALTARLDPKARLRVFLCHASEDKPRVRELRQDLLRDGFQPWLDTEDLLPGQNWDHQIRKAVRESHVVIVCLSEHATQKSGYVQKEIVQALDVAEEKPEGTIFIIPALLEECAVPDRIRKWQWVHLASDGGYEKLILALRAREREVGLSIEDTD
jgi:hypothetical protein